MKELAVQVSGGDRPAVAPDVPAAAGGIEVVDEPAGQDESVAVDALGAEAAALVSLAALA
jgi:hypothetical protein